MAKYLLLEFDDDKDVEFFMQSVADGSVFIEHRNDNDETGKYGYLDAEKTRVRALFQKPTKFCECTKSDDDSPLGKKYGLRVHRKCGYPKRGVCQHPRNLLDPPDMNPRDRQLYLGVWEGLLDGQHPLPKD